MERPAARSGLVSGLTTKVGRDAGIAVFHPAFCTRHLQHGKPFVYEPFRDDARLTLCEANGARLSHALFVNHAGLCLDFATISRV